MMRCSAVAGPGPERRLRIAAAVRLALGVSKNTAMAAVADAKCDSGSII